MTEQEELDALIGKAANDVFQPLRKTLKEDYPAMIEALALAAISVARLVLWSPNAKPEAKDQVIMALLDAARDIKNAATSRREDTP
jgi:hypothetical protein